MICRIRHPHSLLLVIAGVALTSCAPADLKREIEDAPQPTTSQRAEIEAKVRACGLPVRNARWVWVEGLQQWSFNFQTDARLMTEPNSGTSCVAALSDGLRLGAFAPPVIAFSGT